MPRAAVRIVGGPADGARVHGITVDVVAGGPVVVVSRSPPRAEPAPGEWAISPPAPVEPAGIDVLNPRHGSRQAPRQTSPKRWTWVAIKQVDLKTTPTDLVGQQRTSCLYSKIVRLAEPRIITGWHAPGQSTDVRRVMRLPRGLRARPHGGPSTAMIRVGSGIPVSAVFGTVLVLPRTRRSSGYSVGAASQPRLEASKPACAHASVISRGLHCASSRTTSHGFGRRRQARTSS